MSKKHKPYDRMTTEELREATREFDREQVEAPGTPLTKAQREQHRRAKKMGRPKKGAGAAVVGISIEKGLLKKADSLAKRRRMGRSQFFVDAIREAVERAAATGDAIGLPRVRVGPAAAPAVGRSSRAKAG
jgi:hypothetical protein